MKVFNAKKPYNGKIKRISRWIKIRTQSVTPRHSLYMYGYDCNGEVLVDYFMFRGQRIPLELVTRLSYPMFFEDETGKDNYISGVYVISNRLSILVEVDDVVEYVRIYEEIEE